MREKEREREAKRVDSGRQIGKREYNRKINRTNRRYIFFLNIYFPDWYVGGGGGGGVGSGPVRFEHRSSNIIECCDAAAMMIESEKGMERERERERGRGGGCVEEDFLPFHFSERVQLGEQLHVSSGSSTY